MGISYHTKLTPATHRDGWSLTPGMWALQVCVSSGTLVISVDLFVMYVDLSIF